MSISVHTYGKQYDYDDFTDEVNYYASDIDDVYEWLEDEHPRRGDIKIELTAPSGTKSVLLPYRNYDFINEFGYDNWPFMSVHFWGENPVGTWTLKTTYKSRSGYLSLSSVKMTLYGTQQTPTIIANIPSSCHSSCARGCFGEGPENCDVCSNLRLSSSLKCVEECPNGTYAYEHYCLSHSSPESETNTPESETNTPESETNTSESETNTSESETTTPESETNTPESETNTPESETNSKNNPLPLAISISGGVVVLLIMIAVACVMIIHFYRKKKERTVRFRRLQNTIET